MNVFSWLMGAVALLAIAVNISTAKPRIAEKICMAVGGFFGVASIAATGGFIGAYLAKGRIVAMARYVYGVDFSISDGSEMSFSEGQAASNDMLAHIASAADSVVSFFFWGVIAMATVTAICWAGTWIARASIREADSSANNQPSE